MYWTVDFIEKASGGRTEADPVSASGHPFTGISTDTRTIGAGDWFVALKGPRFDGQDHIPAAFEAGCRGFVVRESFQAPAELADKAVFVRVKDTLRALGDIARAHRDRFDIPITAISGSNGKTTTKEMTASVLDAFYGGHVLATRGNFNNLIGLPLTLFGLNDTHRAAVVEVGMSMRGELRRLAEIVHARVGIITNVSAVHLEHLTNIRGVAEAKRELLEKFGPDQTAVLNADDPLVFEMGKNAPFQVRTFGLDHAADATAEDIRIRGFEGIEFTLVLGGAKARVMLTCVGRHNVYNALAAAASTIPLGIPVETVAAGLEKFRPAAMRMRIAELAVGRVLDDCYNSSPQSMDAALSTLGELDVAGRRIVVMGDMRELGPEAEPAHRRIGRHIVRQQADWLFVYGDDVRFTIEGALDAGMAKNRIVHAKSHAEIVASLRELMKPGDVVLVKGSRLMRMELVVRGLKEETA